MFYQFLLGSAKSKKIGKKKVKFSVKAKKSVKKEKFSVKVKKSVKKEKKSVKKERKSASSFFAS